MGFEHQFPYGDVNELNLDWIIQTMQEFINSEREAGHTPTVSSVRSFFTHKYPYGSIHELNLDWVIQTALRMEEIGDSVDGDIGELKTRMTAAEANISTLENTVGGLSDSVSQIETEIEDIQGDVEDLQATAAQHTAQIAALDAKIDAQVVANPADAATDTLSKIEIAGTVYGVEGSGGSEVEANPTGTPTDTLQKIGIDGTIYEVGGGSEPVSKTVTGNPIFITDAADAPIVSGTVVFEPVQDLHGYDKPWAGGAGKNKYKVDTQTSTANGITYTVNSDGTITASGTATAVSQKILGNTTLPAGTYILNGCPSGGSATTYDLRVDNETIETGYGVEFTLSSETSVDVVITVRRGQTVNGVVFKPMIRLATETDPTFEPYENICPIEGYTECELEVTGKNLLQNKAVMPFILRGVTFTQNSDGSITANGTATNGDVILPLWARNTNNVHLPSGQYTYKACPSGGSVNTFYCQLQATRDGSLYEFGSDYGEGVTANVLSTDVMQATIRIVSGATVNNVTFYPQLEKGSTATAYEHYQSTTYTIDLDGTRYGGTVDLVSGEMKVTKGYIASYAGETIGEPWLSDRDEYVPGTTPTTGAEVVYTLATPLEVQLTPEQIRTLEGTNNISTNMTTMSLEYITESYQSLVKLIERSVGHHYSEQERVVGTWFGKTLYEKTVVFENQQLTLGSNVLSLGITNTDLIFPVGVYITNSSKTNIRPLNSYDTGQNTESLFYRILTNTREIDIQAGVVWSSPNIYITLQYTKTTD